MRSGATRPAAAPLETLFRLGTVGGLNDEQLLEQFLARRGEDAELAFAAVVERHGPMVLRVCRRILADPNDAEDAFQVTFLVLARKARSIARRGLLANWLYGVAVRTARELRKGVIRRRAREARMRAALRTHAMPDQPDDELRAALDEELCRLPDSFRAPVVLCDLEGKTHKEAAEILGWPVGTVSSRLVRARERLRARLARRGLDPAAADAPLEPVPMVVPPAMVAATSRAAARLAAGATIAGVAPSYLAAITQGVLKTMVIAKITSKGIVIPAALCLSLGALAVGVIASARSGPASDAASPAGSTVGAWEWVDRLKNADEATRDRLKRCAHSAAANFASLHRLAFDYELKMEVGHVEESGRTTRVDRGFSRGTVYWKEGSVRYDHFPLGKLDTDGRRSLYKRPRAYSVVRSGDMVAYTHQNPAYGLYLTVEKPPRSAEDWESQYPFAGVRRLDPWLHFAEPFCQDRAKLREILENARAIESEEVDGRALLRFFPAGNNARVEITCDRAADWLPVRLRAGDVRDGRWTIFVELTNEWRKQSGVWYPIRHVKTAYYGADLRPVKEIDLIVRNLRANGAVNLPDSAFTLSAMNIPDGTPGLDRRQEPFRGLIRTGGVVREPRPGEGPNPRNFQRAEIERQKDEETIPEEEAGVPAPSVRPDAARSHQPNHEYVSLLEEYGAAHRARERAFLEAKADRDRREAYLALGRLDWDDAPRFLEIARKYPGDVTAIDALGWLVASNFTPPESETAADILIRDHLASDRMISVYRQLGLTMDPAPASAAERLLRAAAEKAPTDEARGLACLRLANLLRSRADAIRRTRGPEPEPFLELEALARAGGQEPVKRPAEDPDRLTAEAVRFYDRAVERYADIPVGSGKLGEWAAQALFHLRNLAVGKPAPEVEGPDVDGQPLRLSDYRGKVVVLIFASGLSGPSRELYARGRALLERMKGRPFTILSVHLDEKTETLRDAISSGEVTWRCWSETYERRPNCDRWHVGFIPSVYVIDADGIIRAKDGRGKALDQAVDAVMATVNRPAAVEAGSSPSAAVGR
jgi:RNA polymerase sigma factor (sigma-70 family)